MYIAAQTTVQHVHCDANLVSMRAHAAAWEPVSLSTLRAPHCSASAPLWKEKRRKLEARAPTSHTSETSRNLLKKRKCAESGRYDASHKPGVKRKFITYSCMIQAKSV
jgi:hypothetical protein